MNVTEDIKTDAGIISSGFANNKTRKRAYINALGGEFLTKWLRVNGVSVPSDIAHIYSISKVLEKLDISDVILPNIHIDVRIVWDERIIFAPKSHFEYNIVPDIYVVIKLDDNVENMSVLGFFTPDKIDKKYQNNDYYFIPNSKLQPVENLIPFIKNFRDTKNIEVTPNEIGKGKTLFTNLIDDVISESRKAELYKLLVRSNVLRNGIIEFEEFDKISYKVGLIISDVLERDAINEQYIIDDDDDEYSFVDDDDDYDDNGNIQSNIVTDARAHQTMTSSETEVIQDAETEHRFEGGGVFEDDNSEYENYNISESLIDDEIGKKPIPEQDYDNEISKQAFPQQTDNNSGITRFVKPTTATAGMVAGAMIGGAIASNIGGGINTAGIVSDAAIDLTSIAGEQPVYNPEQEQAASNKALSSLEDIKSETGDNLSPYEIYQRENQGKEFEQPKSNFEDFQTPEGADPVYLMPRNDEASQQELTTLDEIKSNSEEQMSPYEIYQQEHANEFENSQDNLTNFESINSNADYIQQDDNAYNTEEEENYYNQYEDEQNINYENSDYAESDNIYDENNEVYENYNQEDINADYSDNYDNYTDENSYDTGIYDEENIISEDTNDIENTSENEPGDVDNSHEYELSQISDEEENVQTPEQNADIITETDKKNDSITDNDTSNDEIMTEDGTLGYTDVSEQEDDGGDSLIEDDVKDSEDDELSDLSVASLDEIVTAAVDPTPEEMYVPGETEIPQGDEIFDEIAVPESKEEEIEPEIVRPEIPENVIAYQNSNSISSLLPIVGEIQMDINKPPKKRVVNEYEELENLYDENAKLPGEGLLAGTSGEQTAQTQKAVGIIGVIVSLIVVGVIGFSISKLMKNSQDNNLLPTPEGKTPDENSKFPTSISDMNNIVQMDSGKASKQLKNKSAKQEEKNAVDTFMEVKKLTWEVPDYLSDNEDFQAYFQKAGKSLKMSLASDLLLTNDFSYSDVLKVTINYAKDGSFMNAEMLQASGSTEIDSIVLRTVKQTLKVLKAPASVGNDESTTVILKIYL